MIDGTGCRDVLAEVAPSHSPAEAVPIRFAHRRGPMRLALTGGEDRATRVGSFMRRGDHDILSPPDRPT